MVATLHVLFLMLWYAKTTIHDTNLRENLGKLLWSTEFLRKSYPFPVLSYSSKQIGAACASQFQPRASPRSNPGHLKKMFKCPALRAISVGKCPALRSYYDGQLNAQPSSPSDQYTKLLVAIFNKHNCFSSTELHKTGHEMNHSDRKTDKANGSIAFIVLLWSISSLHLLQNDSAQRLETLDSECRRKWRQDVTKQVFCLQFPGGWDTINCQMPDPGTHRASNVGGMLAAGIDSHIKGEHIRTVNWG